MASKLTFRNSIMLGLLISVLNVASVFAQNCSATLSVEKDRNARSAYEAKGATFNMMLTNTSGRKTTYTISTVNLRESCANENYKTSAPNVSLNVAIKNNENSGAANNSLTLAAGETRKFKIFVTVPAGTPFNTWSCIEVTAKGSECNQPSSSTVLRVYVPEPSDG